MDADGANKPVFSLPMRPYTARVMTAGLSSVSSHFSDSVSVTSLSQGRLYSFIYWFILFVSLDSRLN